MRGCPDRDRDLLASPQVTLLKQHVGHVLLGIDHQSLNRPDPIVAGMDLLAATNFDLSHRNTIGERRVRGCLKGHSARLHAAGERGAIERPGECLTGAVWPRPVGGGQEPRLLGIVERIKLGGRAAELHGVTGRRHERDRHQAAQSVMVGGGDDEMGERLGDRVDDDTDHSPARPVGCDRVDAHAHVPTVLAVAAVD
jgi:hypothetical protein